MSEQNHISNEHIVPENNTDVNTCIHGCNITTINSCSSIEELNKKISKIEDFQNRRYYQVVKELDNLYELYDDLKSQFYKIIENGVLDENCFNDYNDNSEGCGCSENSICGCNCNSSFTSNFTSEAAVCSNNDNCCCSNVTSFNCDNTEIYSNSITQNSCSCKYCCEKKN